jgi:hypothetical protein
LIRGGYSLADERGTEKESHLLFGIVLVAALGQAEVSAAQVEVSSGPRQLEVAGEIGVFVSGIPSSPQLAVLPSVLAGAKARLIMPTAPSPWSHLMLEVSLHGDLTFGSDTGSSLVSSARLGVGFPTWRAAVGVWANTCLRCSVSYASLNQVPSFPAHLLPSFTFHWQPHFWGLSVGLFDEATAMVGHVDLRLGDWAIGYSFPVGGSLAYERRLGPHLGVSVRAFGFSFLGAYQAGMMLGVSWLPL